MTLREFAEKYGLEAQELFDILVFEKFPITGIEEEIDDRVAEYLLEYVGKRRSSRRSKDAKRPAVGREKNGGRRTRGHRESSADSNRRANANIPPVQEVTCIARSMTIAAFSASCAVSAAQVISYWLKKGKLYSVHQELTVDEVRETASSLSIPVIEKQSEACSAISAHAAHTEHVQGAVCKRAPVVVVVGHVDHGKTTLLDYIRKASVAAGEKGGITQHIGAYKVRGTSCSDIVFIDTPGHEAFAAMRSRGLSVADIAILIVAADDGVKPQTIEAIQTARALGLSIIVALNKIDKVSQKEIGRVYQQLAEHELTPEAWGGSTTCVHISAINGKGVSELLEVVCLASELLDLRANMHVPAAGYVLEAGQEKGLGIVGTVILQHGALSVGDYFYSGSIYGKVVSLVDSVGNYLKTVGPSDPVRVSGFEGLPEVGQSLQVTASLKEAKERASAYQDQQKSTAGGAAQRGSSSGERIFNVIVKADTSSSLQALVDMVNKMKGKLYYTPVVIASSLSNLTESDVMRAVTSKSSIYLLHVRADTQTLALANQYGVDVRSFGIIYELLEDLERVLESERPRKQVEKKIGEVLVLKVFPMKGQGSIAGVRVVSGSIVLGARVVAWRGKQKIFAGGPIKSLQRDRVAVKEAQKGYECAFFIEDFSDWQESDRVEIFQDVFV